MPDPQDNLVENPDLARIESEGRAGKAVRLSEFGAAIRKAAPGAASLSDVELFRQFHKNNPQFAANNWNIDTTGATGLEAVSQGPKPAPKQEAPKRDAGGSFLGEAWRGIKTAGQDIASGYDEATGKFYNTLSNLTGMLSSPAMAATGLPPVPPGLVDKATQALHGESEYAYRRAKEVAPKTENFMSPVYRGIGSVPVGFATYAPAMAAGPYAPLVMGAIGGVEEADKGGEAALASAATNAAMGAYLGKVANIPGLKKMLFAGGPAAMSSFWQGLKQGLPADQILANMFGSGTTMAAIVGATPENALTAINEASRIVKESSPLAPVRAVGRAVKRGAEGFQEMVAPLPKSPIRASAAPPTSATAEIPGMKTIEGKATPVSETPTTATPPSEVKPAEPAAEKPPKDVSDVGEELRREAAAGSKKPVDAKRIQVIANSLGQNVDDVAANRILYQLKKHDFINSSREVLPARTQATAAPTLAATPAPATPTAGSTAAPPESASSQLSPDLENRLKAAISGSMAPPAPRSDTPPAPTQITPAEPASVSTLPTPPAPAPPPAGPQAPTAVSTGRTETPPTETAPAPPSKEVIQPNATPAVPEGAGASRLSPEAQAAIARLATRARAAERGSFSWKPTGGEPASTLEPGVFQDLYTVGRDFMRVAGESFDTWRAQMVSTVGDWVDAHLRPIWDNLRATEFSKQPPTVGATAPPPASVQPPAEAQAGAALPPPQPSYPRWDALRRETPLPEANIPPPPGSTSWEQWVAARRAEGMPQVEIERRMEAAMPPETSSDLPGMRAIRGPIARPQGASPTAEARYEIKNEQFLRKFYGPGGPGYEPTTPREDWWHAYDEGPSEPTQEEPPLATVNPVRPVVPPGFPPVQRTAAPPVGGGEVPAYREEIAGALGAPSGKLQQELIDAGLVPAAQPVEQMLSSAGFTPRQNVTRSAPLPPRQLAQSFAIAERAGVPMPTTTSVLSERVLGKLPSGRQATQSFTKPVADGQISVQRNAMTGEFTVSKTYPRGAQRMLIHGSGDAALTEAVNSLQEGGIPSGQTTSGRTGPGGISRFTTAPPSSTEAPLSAEQTRDIIAEAVRQSGLATTTRNVPTVEELQSIIANAAKRATIPPTEREIESPPPPERVAQAVRQVTGGRPQSALDQTVSRIIADAVNRARRAEGIPPAVESGVRPVDMPTAESPKPKRTLVKVPEDSAFNVREAGENAWFVEPKEGGKTDVHISKSGKFFSVFLGTKRMAMLQKLTAAKIEAIKIAEQQAESIRQARPRGSMPPPAPAVTPPSPE